MFKSRKLNSLIFIFVSLTLASDTTVLKGTITDSEGAAIRGARVLVHWDQSGARVGLKSNVGLQQDLILETNAKGEFRAELHPGFYDVFVTANAFSPQCRKIRIKPGETATYNTTLKADPLVTSEMGDHFPQ